ncbi:MAG: hypothetical protein ACRDLN_15305 [Solirubrobacteraceae bacterium]
MSRLRAITARFGAGRKREPEAHDTDGAAAAPAADDEQHGAIDVDGGDLTAPSDVPSLAEFEAYGAALREGGDPAVPDAAPAADAPSAPQVER